MSAGPCTGVVWTPQGRPRRPVWGCARAIWGAIVRLFRWGDGRPRRFLNQPLSLGFDLPLGGELPRLLDATVSRWLLLPLALLALAVLASFALAAALAL